MISDHFESEDLRLYSLAVIMLPATCFVGIVTAFFVMALALCIVIVFLALTAYEGMRDGGLVATFSDLKSDVYVAVDILDAVCLCCFSVCSTDRIGSFHLR
jgi:hypothetical protein